MDRAAACQRWLQRAFVLLFDYIRMWGLLHFNPRGVDASIPGQRYVMVANHPTLVDIAALSAVFGRIVCVAKPLLFRAPFLGQVLGSCVYLEGGEMEGLAVAAVVTQAIDRLAQSMPLLVFPEGTRSPAGGLRRFRRGAFEIACRANVPVVPILIRCEPGALAKGNSVVRYSTANGIFHGDETPGHEPGRLRGRRELADRGVRGHFSPSPGSAKPRNAQIMSDIEDELKEMIVQTLMLKDVQPQGIDVDAPLVRRRAGPGFDRRAGAGGRDRPALQGADQVGRRKEPRDLRSVRTLAAFIAEEKARMEPAR